LNYLSVLGQKSPSKAPEQYQSAALSWLQAGHIKMNSARPKKKGEAEVEKERVNEAMVAQSAEPLVAQRTQALMQSRANRVRKGI
jgi:hypothetical protein